MHLEAVRSSITSNQRTLALGAIFDKEGNTTTLREVTPFYPHLVDKGGSPTVDKDGVGGGTMGR